MARRKRRILRLLLILLLIIGAAALAMPLFPLSPLKKAAEFRLSEVLGRNVTIESVRLNIIRGPHLTFTGMTAQEDPAFGNGVFLRADEARADLDVIEYLRTRQLVIRSMTLRSPQINLVKNVDGVWSWTTVGKRAGQAKASAAAKLIDFCALLIPSPLPAGLPTPTFEKLRIENASVKLIDHTGSSPPEVLYKNIVLNASLSPDAGAGGGSWAKGEVVIQSEEDGGADLLKANLPFNLHIDARDATALGVSGSVGPGPVESKNLSVGEFAITGKIHSERGAPLTGDGQISAANMFIRPINLSENVARALRIEQIGDMGAGTTVSNLETDFRFSAGAVNTTGLRIQQLDGLGDATAQTGSFKIESALTVNYAATIILSSDATARAKSAGPMVGLILTILESNNRVSVPINISGDVRRPEIQVDVNRIF